MVERGAVVREGSEHGLRHRDSVDNYLLSLGSRYTVKESKNSSEFKK